MMQFPKVQSWGAKTKIFVGLRPLAAIVKKNVWLEARHSETWQGATHHPTDTIWYFKGGAVIGYCGEFQYRPSPKSRSLIRRF